MGGKPKKSLDPDQIMSLARLGATTQEIADHFKCSTAHLERKYQAELTSGRSQMRTRLRQEQMKVALDGNVSMLQFLGKQMLGQRDQQDVNITTTKPKKSKTKKKLPKDIYD